jgi:nitric oxide reductase NorD protein
MIRKSSWLAQPRRWLLKARHRSRSALDEWTHRLRDRAFASEEVVPLEQVHRRLELFLTALYGRTISVSPLEDAARHGILRRARARLGFGGPPPKARCAEGAVLLPAALSRRDDVSVLTRYRLLALEQAERLVRGTAYTPLPRDPLERDLFLLHEAAAIDARIARDHHGMAELLERERREAVAGRPKLERMTAAERLVESQVRDLLSSRPGDVEAPSASPQDSLDWARETARSIRASGEPYRGVPLAAIWGEPPDASGTQEVEREKDDDTEQPRSTRRKGRGPATRDAAAQASSSSQEKQDAQVTEQTEAHRDARRDPTSENQGDSASATPRQLESGAIDDLPPPIHYDEWDAEHGVYLRRAVAVRVHDAASGDGSWARVAIGENASTVRRIRHQFERLRSRRALLRRQRAGAELDFDAYVEAVVDRSAGRPLDDRLYIDVRPARRGVAIAVLIDASTSTNRRLSHSQRIIDVERTALLLASEALDALGDLYAIYSFGGQGPSNVKLSVVKSFDEPNGPSVHDRIGAIEPDGFTRLGAAIRHVTAALARQTAGHRMLLILSDGRPHDIDKYQEPYGVEDTRQAVFEARASGVFPYCLTVDADAAEYLPRLFGPVGHTVLRQPEHLPKALISVVNALLTRSR